MTTVAVPPPESSPPGENARDGRPPRPGDTRTINYNGTDYVVGVAHPAADALPWKLDTEEFREVVASMAAGGFDAEKPIYRQRATGLVVCGRRRELAARATGVTPIYRDVDWTDEQIIAFVERDELHRRHLTPSEKAASVVGLNVLKSHGGDRKGGPKTDQVATLPLDPGSGNQAKSHESLAKEAKVSRRTVRSVAKVKGKSEELFAAIREGEIPANVAERLVEAATPKQLKKVLEAANKKAAASEVLRRHRLATAAHAGPFVLPATYQGEPQLDPRFMPNAAEAMAFVKWIGNWKSRLEAIRLEMRKALPDRGHALALRTDLHGKFDSNLAALIDTLDRNVPELPCPPCCGTGQADEKPCKYCQGYGVVNRTDYDGLKGRWPKVEKRLQQLREVADAGGTAA